MRVCRVWGLTSALVSERNGDDVCSLRRVRIWSRLRDEYRWSLPVGLNVMSATSQPHRIESSIAFLNAPTRRFAKVHCSRGGMQQV